MIIGLALIFADQLVGRWLTYAYARTTNGDIGQMNYAFDSTTAPVLVIGSSRAVSNYVTPILTDSLHLTCYNAGRNYQNLFYPLALAACTFQRYHPQTLILDLKPNAFASPISDIVGISVLLPYYHTHPVIQPLLNRRNKWQRWETLSLFYCYKSQASDIVANSLKNKQDSGARQGYIPRSNTLSTPLPGFPEDQLTCTPDTSLLSIFRNIISLAQQNHCHLFVVVSPVYYPLQHGSTTLRAAAEICRSQHIPLLDYSNAPGFAYQNCLFYDGTHLSDSGARKFTRILFAGLHNSE